MTFSGHDSLTLVAVLAAVAALLIAAQAPHSDLDIEEARLDG